MKTNYVWKTNRDKLNSGDLYAGATNNPGFDRGQRWGQYARRTEYGTTYRGEIEVISEVKYGYSHETVSENEQIEINTCRRIAADLNSVGIKCVCLNVQNPNKTIMGVFDQDLYKSILKKWYPKGWAKIKKLRGFAARYNRWKRDKHDGRKSQK
jgi:hypothetical protein